MLRINLLPPYIYEGSKRKKWVALWVLMLIGVIAAAIFWKSSIDKETQAFKDLEASKKSDADLADKKQGDADKVKAESATIRTKADFVKGAQEYDTKTYQSVLDNIATYTWPKVLYDGVTVQGQTVTLPAYAPSLTDVGKYLIYMEHNPDISQVSVQMSSIPTIPAGGGPQGQGNATAGGVRPLGGGGHELTVQLLLNKAIPGAPVFGGGGGGGAQGGTAGAPTGMPGGGAGGMMGGGGASGGMMGKRSD